MKKINVYLFLVLSILLTLNSCSKEKCDFCGSYSGTTDGPVKILFSPVFEINKTLENANTKIQINETAFNDSLNIQIDLDLTQTILKLNINAYKDSETEISINNTMFLYENAIPLLVNGNAIRNDDKFTLNFSLKDFNGTNETIDAVLVFKTN